MAVSPIVPANKSDPTSSQRSVAGASNNFKRRLTAGYNDVNDIIKGLDYDVINVNSRFIVMNQLNVSTRYKYNAADDEIETIYIKRPLKANESVYNYNINEMEMNRISREIGDIFNRLLMIDANGNLVVAETGRQLWFMNGYVNPSYKRGTEQAFNNLSMQSDAYASAVQSPGQVIISPQYQRRVGLVASREFELMEGFTADVIKEARLVLGDGIALGKSPREISKQLKSRIQVTQSRANRIAATEVTGALRAANRAEGLQAEIDFNIKTAFLWMSAFKKTSRQTHIARSGHYHTAKEDEDFYSKNGNRIYCYCTQILTVLDEDGKPLSNTAQTKVQAIKDDYLAENPS